MSGPLVHGTVRVTVQRSTPDAYNDRTWVDHHQVDGCILTPITGGEQTPVVTDQRNLYCPPKPDPDITAFDRILVHPPGVDTVPTNDRDTRRANTYEVLGTPTDWLNVFTGWHPGIQVSLQRVS